MEQNPQIKKPQIENLQVQRKKLQKRLRRDTGKAIADYAMIEDGDKVMVCISGGKDSLTMLNILINLQKHAPINFDLVAVNLDQKQPGFPEQILPNYFQSIGIDYEIIEEDTYSVVTELVSEGKTYCGWCSRFRRGILYSHGKKNAYTKIALGHHRDDIIETLFLNMFHGGKLKTMPPKLLSDDGENIVIRPLAYCRETDIQRYSDLMDFPIIPCNLCGSQENLERPKIKALLNAWDKEFPGRLESIFRSMTDVVPSHLLDRKLHDFDYTKSLPRLTVKNI